MLAGLSQEELAERASMSKRGIADLERGARRTPYPATIRRLASALELSEVERTHLADAARDRPSARDDLGTLFGREAELVAIRHQLQLENVRLLTLVGMAGIGKTRLAVAAAAALADVYADGVCVVYLAPVEDASAVISTIASSLGVHGSASAVAAYLRRRHVLLVLDNCEHVLEAATDVAELLDACPRLAVLATSRAPLQLRRERLHPVPLLPTPPAHDAHTADEMLDNPSIALFVQRARQVRPDFDPDRPTLWAVGELCTRLDGLPLAIELAAARTRLLPPQAIVERLSRPLDVLVASNVDDTHRHRTLRNALDWSYALLSPTERAVLQRLGCFAGGCTLDAALAVCGVDDVEPTLEALIVHSLVKHDAGGAEPRVGMLETVRAYALEKLAASGGLDAARERHATYFLHLAEMALVEMSGPQQMRWLQRIDREWANLRSALAWLAQRARGGDSDAAETGLRLGAALWWYMHVRGVYAEARALVQPLMDATVSAPLTASRGRALRMLGVADWGLGDHAQARAEVEAAMEIARAVGDRDGESLALVALGAIGLSQSDPLIEAVQVEAVAVAEEIGSAWQKGWALTFLGLSALARNDLEEARSTFERAIRIRQQTGDIFGLAWARHGLASVERIAGNTALAEPLLAGALTTFRALGERPTAASILDSLADMALARGDFIVARAYFDDALTMYLDMDSPRGVGIALTGLAAVTAAEGDAEGALRLGGAAEALQQLGGAGMDLIHQRGSTHWLEQARQRIGPEAARAAWLAGSGLGLDDALAQARRLEVGAP
jgi:predicted ATPase